MGQENVKYARSVQMEDVAEQIRSGKLNNIIVLAGAGISVNAGIPDFRTPGTGLYDNLSKFGLPTPESIFTLSYFREHPEAFFTLAKDLYPGKYKPTKTHEFIKFLADRNVLLRCYTQNIDGLEALAGVPANLIVQAHGSFDEAYCIDCKEQQDQECFKTACLKGDIYRCTACDGLCKPSIVFFGEALPSDFAVCVARDFPKCDCLIVMGTSLQVMPFSSLPSMVPDDAIRVLINREPAGNFLKSQFQDVFIQGDCDTGTQSLRDCITL